jgi:hypothetical protein
MFILFVDYVVISANLVKTAKNPTCRMFRAIHPDGCQGISW